MELFRLLQVTKINTENIAKIKFIINWQIKKKKIVKAHNNTFTTIDVFIFKRIKNAILSLIYK